MKKIIFLWVVLAVFFESCKKDNLIKDEALDVKLELPGTKKFYQIAAPEPQQSWYLVLREDGSADIAPGMDTVVKSTYKINGNTLTVNTNRGLLYEFEILSETDVKLKGDNSVVLRWKKI